MYQSRNPVLACGKVSLVILSLLLICSCSDIIISTPAGKSRGGNVVTVTTEPSNSRVIIESMGSRTVWSAYSPAEIKYSPRPGMPTVVTVSKEGYKSKKVRLKPGKNHLHVVLEKTSPFELEFGGGAGARMGGVGGDRGGPSDWPGAEGEMEAEIPSLPATE